MQRHYIKQTMIIHLVYFTFKALCASGYKHWHSNGKKTGNKTITLMGATVWMQTKSTTLLTNSLLPFYTHSIALGSLDVLLEVEHDKNCYRLNAQMCAIAPFILLYRVLEVENSHK